MRAGGPRTQEALYLPYSRLEERRGHAGVPSPAEPSPEKIAELDSRWAGRVGCPDQRDQIERLLEAITGRDPALAPRVRKAIDPEDLPTQIVS